MQREWERAVPQDLVALLERTILGRIIDYENVDSIVFRELRGYALENPSDGSFGVVGDDEDEQPREVG
jgi:hypothetical protein